MSKYTRHALVHYLHRCLAHRPGPGVPPPHRRWPRRLTRGLAILFGVLLTAGVLLLCYLQFLVRASLPPLAGRVRVDGLGAEVRIERDALGIPTLRARDRADLAFATGFVHGQDRYFQMDLMRRHTAGELAELLGTGGNGVFVEEDRKARVHGFRSVARQVLQASSSEERRLLAAYAHGVEAGRQTLRRAPFEYLVLRAEPAPWTEEDAILVGLGMFRTLQEYAVAREAARGLLHDTLPAPLVNFLSPPGTCWDAPLSGPALDVPPIPGPDALDLRRPRPGPSPSQWLVPPLPPPEGPTPGSNSWAVAGQLTAHGGAIVANDMHLPLSTPGIWYRARFIWPGANEGDPENCVTGVTLPGTPVLVAGSNTHIAWGFTNTEGDWSDLVLLQPAGPNPDRYRTPKGPRTISHRTEIIKVKGGADVRLEVPLTVWGPIIGRDHRGRLQALHWVAHDPAAVNFALVGLESARNVHQALAVAHQAGIPAMNFLVGDADGHIAWTVAGRIPRRVGFDGQRPTSWANGKRRWDGWLRPDEYPALVDPPSGLLWTANNRVVEGPDLARIGLGNYDLGARAGQIRDALRAGRHFTEDDMLAIQLDDRALFLRRWQQLALDVLTPHALEADPRREPLRRRVACWGARAAVDSVGFRIVHAFRRRVHNALLDALTEPCRAANHRFSIRSLSPTVEGSVWRLVTERPAHLLPPGQASWEDFLLGILDGIGAEADRDGPTYTWGAVNVVRVRHPFSPVAPLLRWWLDLDMPPEPLPGDWAHMPRIQGPAEGASQRLAVSPGREEQGYFHMPAGQSGHPLSPHYRDGHAAWAHGRPTPFLPGEPVNVLVLVPEH